MTDRPDLESLARSIIDTNLYMVLGTADEGGQPWVAPVYYAPIDDRQFVWVSRPEARHSQHLAVRAEVAIVIFDSSAEIGTGCGVYMSAVAETLTGTAVEVAVEAYSRRHWPTADGLGRRLRSSRPRRSASTAPLRRRSRCSTNTTGACPWTCPTTDHGLVLGADRDAFRRQIAPRSGGRTSHAEIGGER